MESDVLLASFPKCGSFWVRFLMASILKGTVTGLNFDNIESLVPDLEWGDNRRDFAKFQAIEGIGGGLRVFKTHQPFVEASNPAVSGLSENYQLFDELPRCDVEIGPGMEQSQCRCPNCPVRWKRAILVVRDARSVFCSYYHFQKNLGNFEGTFRSFIRDEEASGYGYDYVGWLKSWLEAKDDSTSTSVHVLRYEDLKSDAVSALEPVLRFLRLDVSRELIEMTVEANDFDSMKRKEIRDGGGKLFKQSYPGECVRGAKRRSAVKTPATRFACRSLTHRSSQRLSRKGLLF